jgi:signal transduction histidine kinase
MTISPARGLPLRARLFLLPAIPALLLAAGTGAGMAERAHARATAAAAVRQVEAAVAARDVVHALQAERALAVGVAAGDTGLEPALGAARRATDTAVASFSGPAVRDALTTVREPMPLRPRETATGAADGPGQGAGPGADGTTPAMAELMVTDAEGREPGGAAPHQEVFAGFTRLIGDVVDASFEMDGGEPAQGRDLQALEALTRGKEAGSQERAIVLGAFASGSFAAGEYARFLESRAAGAQAFAGFRRVAGPAGAAALDRALRAGPAGRLSALEERAVAGGVLPGGSRAWHAASAPRSDALRDVQGVVGEQARTAALAAEERHTRRLAMLAAAGAALVLVLLTLSVLTTRSILRPLRRLAAEAAALAAHTEAIGEGVRAVPDRAEAGDGAHRPGLRRGDEFSGVAVALNDLHRAAVRLAAERAMLRRDTAESLVELGKRHRDLAHRQLRVIGALQRRESDAGALTRLCELDRLAGRMRRSSESLLVLAGKRGPRRTSEPLPVADVVRLTLIEVEDHHRVTLRVAEGAMVRGAVVAEVAHLLAELVENALSYSPPDSEVEIRARSDEGECRISITDYGVGMTVEELATANARLRGGESFLVTPTRCLGHYVVGRLAERLGVRVWLHASPRCGVTARVALPEELLVVPPRPERPPELLGGTTTR